MTTAISTDTLTRQRLLSEVPLFARLDAPVLEALAGDCTIFRMEKGEFVALEGDTDVPVCVVAEGHIVGYRVGADGRLQTLVRLQRGAPFYIPCALGTRPCAPVSTRAVVPSTVVSFPQRVFRTLVHAHHALAIAVLAELSNKCDRYVRLAGHVRTLGVRERLALMLLHAAEGQDPPTVFATHEVRTVRNAAVGSGCSLAVWMSSHSADDCPQLVQLHVAEVALVKQTEVSTNHRAEVLLTVCLPACSVKYFRSSTSRMTWRKRGSGDSM